MDNMVGYLRYGTSYFSSDLNSSFFFLLLTTVKQIEVIEVTSATIATTIVREPSEKSEPVKEEFEILTKFLLVKVALPNSQFAKEISNSLFSPEKNVVSLVLPVIASADFPRELLLKVQFLITPTVTIFVLTVLLAEVPPNTGF